jgi:hypothetical protein
VTKAALAGRFVVCPASGFLHPGTAVPVYPSGKKQNPTALCDCMTRIWLPPRRWSEDMGLTIEEVRNKGLELGQRMLFENQPEDTGPRVILCPAGGYLHPGPHAVKVSWIAEAGKKKVPVSHALCTCGTHVWFGSTTHRSRWTERMGYTLDEAKQQQLTITG